MFSALYTNSEDLTQLLRLVHQTLSSQISRWEMWRQYDSLVSRGTPPSRPGCLVWKNGQLSSQLLAVMNTWKSPEETSLGLAGAAAARDVWNSL